MKNSIYLFLCLAISSVLVACQDTSEKEVDKFFLEDSLQNSKVLLLRQAAKDTTLELDTALNNPNSDDPALPVK